MHGEIHTLHDFFLSTEAVIYALAVCIVLGFAWFYYVLTGEEGTP